LNPGYEVSSFHLFINAPKSIYLWSLAD